MTRREEERTGNNPWERVIDNCDLTVQGVNAGGHDKTRMKHAMLNRKADITAGGLVASGDFMTVVQKKWADKNQNSYVTLIKFKITENAVCQLN